MFYLTCFLRTVNSILYSVMTFIYGDDYSFVSKLIRVSIECLCQRLRRHRWVQWTLAPLSAVRDQHHCAQHNLSPSQSKLERDVTRSDGSRSTMAWISLWSNTRLYLVLVHGPGQIVIVQYECYKRKTLRTLNPLPLTVFSVLNKLIEKERCYYNHLWLIFPWILSIHITTYCVYLFI